MRRQKGSSDSPVKTIAALVLYSKIKANLKKIIHNAWSVLTEKERHHFLYLILFDVLISVADILFLFLLLLLMNVYLQQQTGKYTRYLPHWLTNQHSVFPVVVFFLLFSAKNAAGYLVANAQFRFSSRVALRISENNLVKFQQGSFEEYVSIDSSEHIRKIAFQPFEFCQQLLSGLQQLFTQYCLVCITIAGILAFNPQLFLLLLCILLPPVLLVFFFLKKRLALSRNQIRASNETSYRYLYDALKGYVEGNIFLRNTFFLRRFVEARRQFSNHLFNTLSLQSLPARVIEVFAVMGLFVLLLLAQWTGNKDGASLLTVGAFMAAAYKLIPGMVKIINLTGQVKAYEFEAADYENNSVSNSHPEKQQQPIHSLQLKNIGFQFNGVPAFQNLSLSMQKGEFIGIFGKSGRGKTTLLNILLGFLPSQTGEVLINEKVLQHHELKTYWPSIAYVRQQCFLLHDTILRNITLAEEAYDQQRLLQALHLAGLEELTQQSRGGLEKIISENGKNISGGQQQRIALARALYKEADVFLLDEPFNELDETSETILLHRFQKLAASGKIVVMITHNTKAASYCTKTICLDEN